MNEIKYFVLDVWDPKKGNFSVISVAYTKDEALSSTKKRYPQVEELGILTVVDPRDLFQGIAK